MRVGSNALDVASDADRSHIGKLLIGQHPLMMRTHALIEKVAATQSTVLIQGESGTGKELIARAIHTGSPRSSGPFIPVNCGAIPADLLESELFGHERGAFTGAFRDRPGMFQLADGGSIFLDEVAEMSPPLQVKLLRVLQERECQPVGADATHPVDVRVIAATNKDLAREVEAKRFRSDLFYRLQVIPILVPPLRERRSDVPLLIHSFLERLNRTHRSGPKKKEVRVSEEALVLLWEYDWPGNVRELENLVERLVILCEGEVIEADMLPPNVRDFVSGKHDPEPSIGESGFDLAAAVDGFEGRLIDQALRRTHGNKQAAARLLGLKRTTLLAKIRRREERGETSPVRVVT